MSISPTALLLILVAVLGGAFALAGFVWAIRNGHLDPDSAGGASIFDEDECRPPAPRGGK